MYLNDIRIASEEIEQITWRGGYVKLDLRWPWEDLPVLLDVTPPTLWRWHGDDPEAGLPVELLGWRFRRAGSALQLLFRC